jgi:hypothetical protein
MRRSVYYPHLYVVKEDGEAPLRLWALSCLIQDRGDVLPSYQQFISQLKDKASVDSHWRVLRLLIVVLTYRLMVLEVIKNGDGFHGCWAKLDHVFFLSFFCWPITTM